MRLAKEQYAEDNHLTNGAFVAETALLPYLGRPTSACPEGGVYSVNPVGEVPECSYTNECVTWRLDLRNMRVEKTTWKHRLPAAEFR